MLVSFKSKDYKINYLKNVQELNGNYTKVGFPDNGDMSADGKDTLASIAITQEFGGISSDPWETYPTQTFYEKYYILPDN